MSAIIRRYERFKPLILGFEFKILSEFDAEHHDMRDTYVIKWKGWDGMGTLILVRNTIVRIGWVLHERSLEFFQFKTIEEAIT